MKFLSFINFRLFLRSGSSRLKEQLIILVFIAETKQKINRRQSNLQINEHVIKNTI